MTSELSNSTISKETADKANPNNEPHATDNDNNHEDDSIDWVFEGENDEEQKLALAMVVKVLTDRNINSNAFISTIKKVWRPFHNLEASNVGKNLFFFQFFHWRDKQRVMENQPWHFDRHVLLLGDVDGSTKPSDLDLSRLPIWARVYDLPFAGRKNEQNASEDAQNIARVTHELTKVNIVEADGGRKERLDDLSALRSEIIEDGKHGNTHSKTWKRVIRKDKGDNVHISYVTGAKRGPDSAEISSLSKKQAMEIDGGLANPDTERSLRDLCWRDRPNIVFVMETMLDERRLEIVKKKCGFHNGICISSMGNSGGLGFWWNDVNVCVKSYSCHHVEGEVLDSSGAVAWKVIGLYGWAKTVEKFHTWDLMRRLAANGDQPLVMFGDFNEITSKEEKLGGAVRQEAMMQAFRDAIDDCHLRDLGCKGNLYTWQRGTTVETLVKERLDRFLATSTWCSLFSDVGVTNLAIHNSDHAPILLKQEERRRSEADAKLKKFESFWLENDDSARMGYVLERLSSWAKDSFGDIKKRLKEAEKNLKQLQGRQPDAMTLEQCNRWAMEINDLRRQVESYWHLRAKTNELRDGDRNTSYFHHKASARRKRNSIKGLYNDENEWKTEVQDVADVVTSYFQNLFASGPIANVEEATVGLSRIITEDMNRSLNADPSNEEIKDALFQMHPRKAPGPDGMHALFLQKFWHIIGPDVCAFVKSWWRGNVSLEGINETCIALIPKCSDPKYMKEFRPISLCNVSYKIISKTMANRLKPMLSSLISINQSAFVPKRLITDNALIGFEIFHAMKRRGEGKDGSLALKLDMCKAYDRVDWEFLSYVMNKLGFDGAWIERVQRCLHSISFTFKINGSNMGAVCPTRGLRQGDPISPYLFLLCADAFSTLLAKAASEGDIHGYRVCRGAPRVSHLFFADDSLLFAKANSDECSKVADIISLYERASGQLVNLEKSEVCFSHGVSIDRRWEIIETLGVKEVEKHDRYLGLPTIIGRSKKAIFSCIKERIWKKLQGWKEKLLSKPGKEILIKAVAQAIPTYLMSIFKLPDGLLDDTHSLLAKFWWGNGDNERKLHWRAWDKLCIPKAMGGMGFRDLKTFNLALLAKQVWRLMNGTDSLTGSILKARYFKNDDILDARRGHDPSFTWRSLWGSKSLLQEGLAWRIGTGTCVNVWSSNWLLSEDGPKLPAMQPCSDTSLRVCDLIDFTTGQWNEEIVAQVFNAEDKEMVLNIPLSSRWPRDELFWWPYSDGLYTVKSGYWLGRRGAVEEWLSHATDEAKQCWRLIWDMKIPPKLQHFLWRACNGFLSVMERLFSRYIVQSKSCQICGGDAETILHSLFECEYARKIWNECPFGADVLNAPCETFGELLVWAKKNLDHEKLVIFATLSWSAWSCRNKAIFDNITPNATVIAQGLINFALGWVECSWKCAVPIARRVNVVSVSEWHKPHEGWLKVNVDVHISDEGFVGAGAVVRDCDGVITLAAVRRRKSRWEPKLGELYAIRFGLQLAHRFNFSKIIVETDSLEVAQKIAVSSSGKSQFHLLLDDVLYYNRNGASLDESDPSVIL
ncbi:hypothetical protein RDABS01_016388 [Bienertia sinuspersici]